MISGTVIHGEGMGKKYGFPTANVDCKLSDSVSQGVYAAKVTIGKKEYKGALAIQENPCKCEVHIFDFNEDIYGTYIEIELVQKVSEMERYDSTAELVDKITQDVHMVKAVFISEQ